MFVPVPLDLAFYIAGKLRVCLARSHIVVMFTVPLDAKLNSLLWNQALVGLFVAARPSQYQHWPSHIDLFD